MRKSNKTKCPTVGEFYKKGYLILQNALSKDIISNIKLTFNFSKWSKEKSMIFEEDGVTPRSLFGLHKLDFTLIKSLIKKDILALCKKILDDECYIYQSHINYKRNSGGGEYWWHSDFTFWHSEGGMRAPNALSLVFFLDKVNKSNGPLEVIPGSHHFTYTNKLSRKFDNTNIRHDRSTIYSEDDYAEEGLISMKDIKKMKTKPVKLFGNAGDMIIMDANLWHYSSKNKSIKDRMFLFIVLNSFSNQSVHYTRPDYLVETNPQASKI